MHLSLDHARRSLDDSRLRKLLPQCEKDTVRRRHRNHYQSHEGSLTSKRKTHKTRKRLISISAPLARQDSSRATSLACRFRSSVIAARHDAAHAIHKQNNNQSMFRSPFSGCTSGRKSCLGDHFAILSISSFALSIVSATPRSAAPLDLQPPTHFLVRFLWLA